MGARKRSIDPGIWGDEGFLELSDGARLFFLGLMSNADDEGRGAGSAKTLKAKIFPADEKSIRTIEGYKTEVTKHTHTVFYEVGGVQYYALLKWTDYQKVDHPTPSSIPAPSKEAIAESFDAPKKETVDEYSSNVPRMIPESSVNNPGTFDEQSSDHARPLALINELINKSINQDSIPDESSRAPLAGGSELAPRSGAPPASKMDPRTRAAVLPLVTGMIAAAEERQARRRHR